MADSLDISRKKIETSNISPPEKISTNFQRARNLEPGTQGNEIQYLGNNQIYHNTIGRGKQ